MKKRSTGEERSKSKETQPRDSVYCVKKNENILFFLLNNYSKSLLDNQSRWKLFNCDTLSINCCSSIVLHWILRGFRLFSDKTSNLIILTGVEIATGICHNFHLAQFIYQIIGGLVIDANKSSYTEFFFLFILNHIPKWRQIWPQKGPNPELNTTKL